MKYVGYQKLSIAKSDVNLSTIKRWTFSSWQYIHLHGRILPTSYDKILKYIIKTFLAKLLGGKGHPPRSKYNLLQKFEYEGKKLQKTAL